MLQSQQSSLLPPPVPPTLAKSSTSAIAQSGNQCRETRSQSLQAEVRADELRERLMEIGGEVGRLEAVAEPKSKRVKSAIRGCLGRQPYFKVISGVGGDANLQ